MIGKRICVIVLAGLLLFCAACGSGEPTRNIGLTTNLGTANFTFFPRNPKSIDDIIPEKADLIASLEGKGYVVTEYNTSLGSEQPAQRVYAKKGNHFVDISYGLTIEQAKAELPQYRAAYEVFYLMAQNEQYLYCISDKQAFEDAGFTSLANIGIQYIYYE